MAKTKINLDKEKKISQTGSTEMVSKNSSGTYPKPSLARPPAAGLERNPVASDGANIQQNRFSMTLPPQETGTTDQLGVTREPAERQ
jgi:hypothetical protein